jgi:integrase/recombinase XerD
MAQAKVLSERDIRKVLLHIASRPHAARNRAMFLMTVKAGMRCCEVAGLRLTDVLNRDGSIKDEIRLSAEQTKGNKGNTVLLSKEMQGELHRYLTARFLVKDLLPVTLTDTTRALFPTQKNPNRGFTANTLAQHFGQIYKAAGLDGCSSHSGRRSFLTTGSEKGISARLLQVLARHSSLATTQRYIEASPSQLRKALEMI